MYVVPAREVIPTEEKRGRLGYVLVLLLFVSDWPFPAILATDVRLLDRAREVP